MKANKIRATMCGAWAKKDSLNRLAEKNIATMSKCTFQKVITTDPHTLNALKNEYPDYGGKWDTIHYTRLLTQLIEAGKIKINKKLNYRVTFHDPCYLGRYNKGFNPPRELIKATGFASLSRCRATKKTRIAAARAADKFGWARLLKASAPPRIESAKR